jgi:hypothetical protein
MTAVFTRKFLAFLLAAALCGAPVLPQPSQQPVGPSPNDDGDQSSPPQTGSNDSQISMAPRPNPKQAKKLAEQGDKARIRL